MNEGPSGLGASRAEEKGASRLARAGVTCIQYVELLGKYHVLFTGQVQYGMARIEFGHDR